jgi:hypothetical protein
MWKERQPLKRTKPELAPGYIQTHKRERKKYPPAQLLSSFPSWRKREKGRRRRKKEKNNADVPCQHINKAANPSHPASLFNFFSSSHPLVSDSRFAVSVPCVCVCARMIIAHLDFLTDKVPNRMSKNKDEDQREESRKVKEFWKEVNKVGKFLLFRPFLQRSNLVNNVGKH